VPDPELRVASHLSVVRNPPGAFPILFLIDVRGARNAGIAAILHDPLDRYHGEIDCLRIATLAQLLDALPERPARAG